LRGKVFFIHPRIAQIGDCGMGNSGKLEAAAERGAFAVVLKHSLAVRRDLASHGRLA
jgi:hypothetical protein